MRIRIGPRLVWVGFLAVQAFGQQLSLEEAVQRAAQRGSERERALFSVALAHENYLAAQSRFRWEFRPRVSLLAFTNPLLLASSLGLGLSVGRNQPPEWVRQNARIDSLAAEVAVERAAMKSRLEAVRVYFNTVQRRQSRDHLAQALKAHRAGRRTLDERTQSAQLTVVNRGAWELRSIALESELEDAESALESVRSALAEMVGASQFEGSQLAEAGPALANMDLPAGAFLRQVVFAKKDKRTGLRQKLEAAKRGMTGRDSIKFNSISFGYSRLNDHRQSAALGGQNGLLLGGHTGTLDLGVTLPLRKTGEEQALRQYAAARLRAIEVDLDSMDDMLSRELETLRTQALSSRRKAEAAVRRLKVVSEITRLIALREQNGLETAEAKLMAEADLVRARYDLDLAETETRIHWMQLKAACRIDDIEMQSGTMIGHIAIQGLDLQSARPAQ